VTSRPDVFPLPGWQDPDAISRALARGLSYAQQVTPVARSRSTDAAAVFGSGLLTTGLRRPAAAAS